MIRLPTLRFWFCTLLLLCIAAGTLSRSTRPFLFAAQSADDEPDLPDVHVAWMSDDLLAVLNHGSELTSDDERGALIYTLSKPEQSPAFYAGRQNVVFASDQYAASYSAAGSSGEVVLWNPATGVIDTMLPDFLEAAMDIEPDCPLRDHVPNQLDLSFDGRLVARPERDGTVSLFSTTTGEVLIALTTVACPIVDLGFSIDGSTLVILHSDHSIQMFSTVSGERFWRYEIAEGALPAADTVTRPFRLTFSPQGDLVAMIATNANTSGDGTVLLIDAQTGMFIDSLGVTLPDDQGLHAVFSPDGVVLVISDASGLRVFESASLQLLLDYPLANHQRRAASIAFSPEGSRLAYYDFESAAVRFIDTGTLTLLDETLAIAALQPPSPTSTITASASATVSPTTAEPTTAAPTNTETLTSTATLTPSATVTAAPSATVTASATATIRPSVTPRPSATPGDTPTIAPSDTPVVPTKTDTATPGAAEAACLNAPPSQLTVGAEAMVTFPNASNLPHTLRVRATPNGDILGVLISGNRVRVLEGSICENNLLWWRIETLDGRLSGWSAEGEAPQVYYLTPVVP